MSGGARISPTAHYTGAVWVRAGLSDPELATTEGRLLYDSLRPVMTLAETLGLPTLEPYLLGRHRALDAALERAISAGEISQVVEIAAGMSGRGLRFARRYGAAIDYVEADLPAMAARKQTVLHELGALGPHHRVATLDALTADGPQSLTALAATLDPQRGVAVITEGLLPYLHRDAVLGLWKRIAGALDTFPAGRYLSDLHLGVDASPVVRAFTLALAAFVRGGVRAHFEDAATATAALLEGGFTTAEIRDPEPLVHIIEASTVRPT
jgi:O-methyltransferase involved in polyketide biosynthesis